MLYLVVLKIRCRPSWVIASQIKFTFNIFLVLATVFKMVILEMCRRGR